jgi:hypothetical protein
MLSKELTSMTSRQRAEQRCREQIAEIRMRLDTQRQRTKKPNSGARKVAR